MSDTQSKPKIHLYMDDWRPCPEGFALARTGEECLTMLQECEVGILSLDHEMGPGELSGSEVAARIVANGTFPREIYLHTSSDYGRRSMYQTLYAGKPDDVVLHRGPMPDNVRRDVANESAGRRERICRMRETTEKELGGWIEAGERQIIVFGHTPFCGTCKAARRMLEVVEQMRPDIDVYGLDLNFAPGFVREYKIGSTPSLSVFEPGRPREPRTIYAMQSVPRLLDFIENAAE